MCGLLTANGYSEWSHREDDVVADDDMPPVCDIEYGCATGIRNVCVCVRESLHNPTDSASECVRVSLSACMCMCAVFVWLSQKPHARVQYILHSTYGRGQVPVPALQVCQANGVRAERLINHSAVAH